MGLNSGQTYIHRGYVATGAKDYLVAYDTAVTAGDLMCLIPSTGKVVPASYLRAIYTTLTDTQLQALAKYLYAGQAMVPLKVVDSSIGDRVLSCATDGVMLANLGTAATLKAGNRLAFDVTATVLENQQFESTNDPGLAVALVTDNTEASSSTANARFTAQYPAELQPNPQNYTQFIASTASSTGNILGLPVSSGALIRVAAKLGTGCGSGETVVVAIVQNGVTLASLTLNQAAGTTLQYVNTVMGVESGSLVTYNLTRAGGSSSADLFVSIGVV